MGSQNSDEATISPGLTCALPGSHAGFSGSLSGATLVDFSSTAKITATIGAFSAASGTDYAALARANTAPAPSGTVPEPAS